MVVAAFVVVAPSVVVVAGSVVVAASVDVVAASVDVVAASVEVVAAAVVVVAEVDVVTAAAVVTVVCGQRLHNTALSKPVAWSLSELTVLKRNPPSLFTEQPATCVVRVIWLAVVSDNCKYTAAATQSSTV